MGRTSFGNGCSNSIAEIVRLPSLLCKLHLCMVSSFKVVGRSSGMEFIEVMLLCTCSIIMFLLMLLV